jgi:GT2 family glycosyltransferase
MISFVIITHNSERTITACIEHISSIKGIPYEIIVVDNNSRDMTKQVIRSKFDNVRLIELHRNMGYGRGANLGIKHARKDIIFLLNPDSYKLTHDLKNIPHYLSTDHVGVLGPKILNASDGRRQLSARNFPTLRTALFNRGSILTRLVPNNRFSREYLNPITSDDTSQQVDWVSGCAMIVRKDIFNAIGGFCEDYFLFHEDVDFCNRLARAGYRVVYYPDVSVSHEIGISKTVPTIGINYERHRGMWLYYTKYFQRNLITDALVACGILLRFMMTSAKVMTLRLYNLPKRISR